MQVKQKSAETQNSFPAGVDRAEWTKKSPPGGAGGLPMAAIYCAIGRRVFSAEPLRWRDWMLTGCAREPLVAN